MKIVLYRYWQIKFVKTLLRFQYIILFEPCWPNHYDIHINQTDINVIYSLYNGNMQFCINSLILIWYCSGCCGHWPWFFCRMPSECIQLFRVIPIEIKSVQDVQNFLVIVFSCQLKRTQYICRTFVDIQMGLDTIIFQQDIQLESTFLLILPAISCRVEILILT